MKLQKKITGAISLIAMIASATTVIGQEIKVWTTETQPARLERQAKMAAEYEASTGVKVEMIPVEESEMGTRATAAFAAGDLPDVIYYGLQYSGSDKETLFFQSSTRSNFKIGKNLQKWTCYSDWWPSLS